jgi:hypothetical protein
MEVLLTSLQEQKQGTRRVMCKVYALGILQPRIADMLLHQVAVCDAVCAVSACRTPAACKAEYNVQQWQHAPLLPGIRESMLSKAVDDGSAQVKACDWLVGSKRGQLTVAGATTPWYGSAFYAVRRAVM